MVPQVLCFGFGLDYWGKERRPTFFDDVYSTMFLTFVGRLCGVLLSGGRK
jgi:hypothetical protein